MTDDPYSIPPFVGPTGGIANSTRTPQPRPGSTEEPTPETEKPNPALEEFGAALSEYVAISTHRIIHRPFANVDTDETYAFERIKQSLAELLANRRSDVP